MSWRTVLLSTLLGAYFALGTTAPLDCKCPVARTDLTECLCGQFETGAMRCVYSGNKLPVLTNDTACHPITSLFMQASGKTENIILEPEYFKDFKYVSTLKKIIFTNDEMEDTKDTGLLRIEAGSFKGMDLDSLILDSMHTNFISPQAFSGAKVKELELTNLQIHEIPSNLLSPLGDVLEQFTYKGDIKTGWSPWQGGCAPFNYTLSIATNAFDHLKKLADVSIGACCGPVTMPPAAFAKNTNLDSIEIKAAMNVFLDEHTLDGAHKTTELLFDYAKNLTIDVRAMKHLTSLQAISFQDAEGQIGMPPFSHYTPRSLYVSANVFVGSPQLQIVNFASGYGDENQTLVLEANAFNGADRIETLVASDRGMTSLPKGVFQNFQQLKKLDLTQNHLSGDITTWLTPNLRTLEELDILANDYVTFAPKIFEVFGNLKQITLGGRYFSSLSPGTFLGLGNVTKFLLESSVPLPLGEYAFTGLSKLTNLDMGGTDVISISNTAFAGLDSLSRLYLTVDHSVRFSLDAFRPFQGRAVDIIIYVLNGVSVNNLTISDPETDFKSPAKFAVDFASLPGCPDLSPKICTTFTGGVCLSNVGLLCDKAKNLCKTGCS